MVAVFHFSASGPIYSLSLVRHAHLFVDFFFVLSGFVIMLTYGTTLGSWTGVRRFLILRVGRIYPLHIVALFSMLSLGLIRLALPNSNLTFASFAEANRLPMGQIVEALLLHAVPGIASLSTGINVPSRSISTELWAYAAFAAVAACVGFRRWQGFAVIALPVLGLVFIENGLFSSELYRCICGFSIGCVSFFVYKTIGDSFGVQEVSINQATTIEIVTVLGIGTYVAYLGDVAPTLLASYVFAPAILVFAFAKGHVSELLKAPFFTWLGKISFSIYMTHWVVQYAMGLGAKIIERISGSRLLFPQPNGSFVWGATAWEGSLAYFGMGASTIAVSALTYRFIELRGQKWARSMADPRRASEPAAVSSA